MVDLVENVPRRTPVEQPPRRGWMRVGARAVGAVTAGGALYLSFPPYSAWYLTPVGFALLVLVLRGRSVRTGFGYGYLAGLAFFVPLLPWVGVYVGALPWLVLAAIEALSIGLFGAMAAALSRLPCSVVWIASVWVLLEGVRSRLPFGGFPWGRLAFGQADGVLLPLAGVAGAPGLSFAVALLGCGLAGLITALSGRHWMRMFACMAIVTVPLMSAMLLSARPTPAPAAMSTVALVQGNVPRLGLDFNSQRRAVLDNHVAKTKELARDVDAGRLPRPQLVIWPENASDIDPLRNGDAATRITDAARAVGVPILVGAVLTREDGTTLNSAIVWDPDSGPGEQHVKRKLVPFGEYLPLPGVMNALSSYAARAGKFVPGDGNGVVTLNGTPTAVATCYEVAFDDLVRDSVRSGAQVITVPTNNATFGRTDMTYQQLAMSRVRAVEHGRPVLVAATSGVSAIIESNGAVLQQSGIFTDDVLVGDVQLRSDMTLAIRIGPVPEIVISLLALGALLVSVTFRVTRAAPPTKMNSN